MTVNRRDSNDTPYGNWLRHHPLLDSRRYNFDNQNLDYIWFAFSISQGWYILIEEKRYLAKQSFSQNDTHGIINQHLKSVPKNTKVLTGRGSREIEYRGYYLIQFQKTNPSDSDWGMINGIKYRNLKAHILCLHKYGILLDPDIDFNLPSPILAIQAGLSIGQISLLRKEIQ